MCDNLPIQEFFLIRNENIITFKINTGNLLS